MLKCYKVVFMLLKHFTHKLSLVSPQNKYGLNYHNNIRIYKIRFTFKMEVIVIYGIYNIFMVYVRIWLFLKNTHIQFAILS